MTETSQITLPSLSKAIFGLPEYAVLPPIRQQTSSCAYSLPSLVNLAAVKPILEGKILKHKQEPEPVALKHEPLWTRFGDRKLMPSMDSSFNAAFYFERVAQAKNTKCYEAASIELDSALLRAEEMPTILPINDAITHKREFTNCFLETSNRTGTYACTFQGCSKYFSCNSRLQRHILVHTGEKPYFCLQSGCKKRFSRRDNMMQHYRTHLIKIRRSGDLSKDNVVVTWFNKT